MKNDKWKEEDILAVGESIIYKCEVENENGDKVPVLLTNYRIVWIDGDFIDCRLLKFVSKYGVFVGYEEYMENGDYGIGEYGVYFGDTVSYTSLWFYSEKVWKSFYEELSRTILEII